MDYRKIKKSYDLIAPDYAHLFQDELNNKEFDRNILKELVDNIDRTGIICDLGCGPGQVGAYLKQLCSNKIIGVDISAGMLSQARKLNPEIEYVLQDITNLDFPNNHFQAIVAFYSIIHIVPEKLPMLFKSFSNIIQPGGLILIAFHRGDEIRTFEEFHGKDISIDMAFFEPEKINLQFQQAGFSIKRSLIRPPYPEEFQTERCYVLAQNKKPLD